MGATNQTWVLYKTASTLSTEPFLQPQTSEFSVYISCPAQYCDDKQHLDTRGLHYSSQIE